MTRRRTSAGACTAERRVLCPCCRRLYRIPVQPAWYRRQWRRLLGWPQLLCLACEDAGGDVARRNPERAAY